MKVKNFFFDHRNNEDKKNVDNSDNILYGFHCDRICDNYIRYDMEIFC